MSWFINQANAQQPALVPAEGGHVPTDAAGTTVAHQGGEHGGGFPPFDPSTFPSQLFWLAIVFIALYVMMAKKIVPQLNGIFEARAAKIAGDLVEAEKAKAETDAAIASYEASLAAARNRANVIAHDTRSKVAREIDGRRHAAEAQLADKLSETEKHIADVKNIALDHVSTIAIETTEAVVEALVGRVGRDEAAAAVAAVSAGKH